MKTFSDGRAAVRGMRSVLRSTMVGTFALVLVGAAICGSAMAQAVKTPYPQMAPMEQYMMPEAVEVEWARSAAPASISAKARVLVLRRDGYGVAADGGNGWTCMVERSWGNATDSPEFWNPKMRAPHCFNAQAARTFLPIYLMKTKMVMAGERSREKIFAATEAAFQSGELKPVERGAAAYMMSKHGYLNDDGKAWHPHVMFFVPGDQVKTWGADLPGSPVIAAYDAQEHCTILFVLAAKWSDGTPGPAMK